MIQSSKKEFDMVTAQDVKVCLIEMMVFTVPYTHTSEQLSLTLLWPILLRKLTQL